MSLQHEMDAYIRSEWIRRVSAEYSSASITAQVVHWMIICTLPEDIILMGLRIVGDELTHSRLGREVLESLGHSADVVLPTEHLEQSTKDGVWNALVDHILRSFCLGETFAVPLFEAMRKNASQRQVLAMLTSVLQDEAVHRAFAWTVLDALLDKDREAVVRRVQQKVPIWLQQYEEAYGRGIVLDEHARAHGLLDGALYKTIIKDTIHHSILPRFFKRGISVDYTSIY